MSSGAVNQGAAAPAGDEPILPESALRQVVEALTDCVESELELSARGQERVLAKLAAALALLRSLPISQGEAGEPVARAWLHHGKMVNAFPGPPCTPEQWAAKDHDGYWSGKGYSEAPLYLRPSIEAVHGAPSPLNRESPYFDALVWALGSGEDFPPRQPGDGAYWWRRGLQERAGLEWDGKQFIPIDLPRTASPTEPQAAPQATPAVPIRMRELPRELMESCLAAAQEATFQGFADSVVKDQITRLHETVYRMGFESGWRIREQQARASIERTPAGVDAPPQAEEALPPLPEGYTVMMTPDPNGTPAVWYDEKDMREYVLADRASRQLHTAAKGKGDCGNPGCFCGRLLAQDKSGSGS